MRVFVFLCAILAVSGNSVYGTIGDVWDVGLDFSYTTGDNPNGVWSYLYPDGTTLLPHVDDVILVTDDSGGWGPPGDILFLTGPGPMNSIFGPVLVEPGELFTYGSVVRWTSPINGWVEISGSMVQIYGEGITGARLPRMLMSQNGIEFSKLYGKQDAQGVSLTGLGMTHENRVHFDAGTSGTAAMYRQVSVGDTLSFKNDGTPQAELPIPYTGSGTYDPGYPPVAFDIQITQVDPCSVPQFVSLTMQIAVEDNFIGNSNVSPSIGAYEYLAGSSVPISAQSMFMDCPSVLDFDRWEGVGIANPDSPDTFVFMDEDKTVTAVFADGRVCGDQCNPSPTYDLTGDCRIDLGDFAAIAAQWLVSANPDDDGL